MSALLTSIRPNIWISAGLCCNGGLIFWMPTGMVWSDRLNLNTTDSVKRPKMTLYRLTN